MIALSFNSVFQVQVFSLFPSSRCRLRVVRILTCYFYFNLFLLTSQVKQRFVAGGETAVRAMPYARKGRLGLPWIIDVLFYLIL